MCLWGKGSAFIRNCSMGMIFLLCVQCCAQWGSVLHCVGQGTLGTVTIWVPNDDCKYEGEAYGLLHTLHSRKIVIRISVSQAHMQRKGKSPKYLYGDREKVNSSTISTFLERLKPFNYSKSKMQMFWEPSRLCAYADNTCCALIPVRDLNRFLLGAQKAFILY